MAQHISSTCGCVRRRWSRTSGPPRRIAGCVQLQQPWSCSRGRAAAEGPFEQLVDVSHPMGVHSDPVTRGPSLYIDLDRATHVEGISECEGRALLQLLQDHAEAHAPRLRALVATHDVLVWDEHVAYNTRRAGTSRSGEPRRFWRFMIEGPGLPHTSAESRRRMAHRVAQAELDSDRGASCPTVRDGVGDERARGARRIRTEPASAVVRATSAGRARPTTSVGFGALAGRLLPNGGSGPSWSSSPTSK